MAGGRILSPHSDGGKNPNQTVKIGAGSGIFNVTFQTENRNP